MVSEEGLVTATEAPDPVTQDLLRRWAEPVAGSSRMWRPTPESVRTADGSAAMVSQLESGLNERTAGGVPPSCESRCARG